MCDKNAYPIPYDEFRKYSNDTVVHVKGTLQNYDYFSKYKDEILPLFDINSSNIKNKTEYSDIDDAYFLHVRRGDFVNKWFHYIDLTKYYNQALTYFNQGTIYVFSNDILWCEDWNLLKDRRCKFIKENEVDSLALMANCKRGGIGANSSFSWWGLFLSTTRQNLIYPSRFFPHDILFQDGYTFPEMIVVSL